jgi:adenylate kinase family enzyme
MSSERLILIGGPPGSGKSSVAESVALKRNIEHLSMGNYLRAIGRQAVHSAHYEELDAQQEALSRASPLPRELVLKIIEEYLSEKATKKTVIIDGYPRVVEQVDPFFALVERTGVEPQVHINLLVAPEVAAERMTARGARLGEVAVDFVFAHKRLRQHEEAYPITLNAIEQHVPICHVDANAEQQVVEGEVHAIIDLLEK